MTGLVLKIIVSILALSGGIFLGLGIYISELISMIIGGLLICASLLVLPEVKRTHRYPFL